MTATRPFISLFGIAKDADIVKVAVAAVRHDYAVLPIRPSSKAPMCTLNEHELSNTGPHPCGVKHAISDDKEAKRVFTRLAGDTPGQLNLAVVAHPSRLIVIDADTADSVAAFQKRVGGMTPTCRTPGVVNQDGTWTHRGGGHFYFNVPDGLELESRPGQLSIDGYDIRYGNNYTLVPPSVRSEGLYVPTGEVLPAPQWLVEEIVAHTRDRQNRIDPGPAAARDWEDPIAVWSRSTSWEALLAAEGWTRANVPDSRCGCPVFTRPGGGTSSQRSATGHNNNCSAYPNVEGHGPLHLWTTNRPEQLSGLGDTLTKLTYVAAMRFNGDEQSACVNLGLRPNLLSWIDQSADPAGAAPTPDEPGVVISAEPGDHDHHDGIPGDLVVVADLRDAPTGSTPSDARTGGSGFARDERFWERHPNLPDSVRADVKRRAAEMSINKLATQYSELMLSDRPPAYTLRGGPDLADRLDASGPEDLPTVGQRTDGKCLLYPGRISVVAGPPGAGKSWLTLLIAQQCLDRGEVVVILDFEDSNHLTANRLRAIGVDVDSAIRADLLYLADIDGVMSRDDLLTLLEELERLRPAYVALDSANAMITMFGDITDNTTVTWVYRELWRSAMNGGYAMLIVDHVPNNRARRAIGAQAKQAALTGTFFLLEKKRTFAEGKEGESLLSFKDKDRPGGVAVYADELGRVGLLRIRPDISDTGTFGTVARLDPVPEGYGSDEEEEPDLTLDCAAAVMQKLREQGGVATRNQIRDSVSSKLKKHLEKALKYLANDALIEMFSEGRKSMIRMTEE